MLKTQINHFYHHCLPPHIRKRLASSLADRRLKIALFTAPLLLLLLLLLLLTRPPKPNKPRFNHNLFTNTYSTALPSVGINANLGISSEGAKIEVSRKDSTLSMTIPLNKAQISGENNQVVYTVPEKVVETRYKPLDNGLKEEIVLNQKPGNSDFSTEINVKNLSVKITSEGIPVFYDSKTGEYQFHFERPFAKDAKGNVTYGVSYKLIKKEIPKQLLSPLSETIFNPKEESLQKTKKKILLGNPLPIPLEQNAIYVLITTVDPNWLNDPQRVYPIVIDPSVVYNTSTAFAAGTLNRIADTGSPNLETYYQELPADIYTVGLWHMNNNWNDSSGNGNNGTASGATFTSSAVLGSYAGNFDGVDDRVYLSSGANANITGDITIEAWVYPTLTSTSTVIHKDYQYSLRIENTGNIYWADSSNWSYGNFGATNIGLVANKWQHLAVTKTGGIVRIYLDGIEKASKSFGGPITSTSNVMHIGCYSGAGADSCSSSYFPGRIDEVRISNIARTPEEIKADAQRRPYGVYTSDVIDLTQNVTAWNSLSWTEVGVGTDDGETLANSTGLVAQWNFNETSGTTATNNAGSCGSSCNGTLTNFANTSGQDVAAGSGWTSANRRWGAGALMFDGTDDYVSVTNNASLNIGSSFSAEVWVKTSTTGIRYIYRKVVSSAEDKSLSVDASGKAAFYLYNTFGGTTLASNKTVTDGQWHYIAVTYDGSTAKIYIDGLLDNSKSASGDIANSNGDLIIGSSIAGGYFQGIIDSLRWYTRPLTASEILANYNAGNIELQTRVGADASPDDGSWQEWRPVSNETSLLSLDSDQTNWSWDNTATYMPKLKSDESVIKVEGAGSMKLGVGAPQPDANTVGLWHLDETSVGTGSTAYDSSGNNLSAIATGTTLVNGFAGKARKFNGSGDYLSIADNTALKPSTITIEAWVRPDSFASYASLVCKMRDSGGPYGSSYKLGFDLSNHFSFGLFDGSRWHTAIGNTSITTGQWYHVMGTYDGSDVKIYVNGVLDGKTHWGGQINYLGTRPVIIGAAEELANFGVTSFFNGIIDEVKISNIAQPSDVAMETYLAGSSHRLTRSFSTLDLSTKNKIPFYVASDRQGTFMEATIGESAFANYEPDANTVGLWHLEENTPSFTDGFLTDSNGYPTTQLFGGISGGWSSTGCGDVSSNQTGFLDQYPSPGDSFGGKTWEIASSSNGSFNLDSVICGGDCNNVYSYSLIYLYSPTAQTIRFKWGSDDASQVWVNGSLKYTVSSCQGLTIDQFSVDTPINAGWNRILWRAVEGGGGYWLAWRITDTYNNPLRMIYRVSNPSNSSTVKDASSFGNNGTSYGTTSVQGKIGKGRSFNGSSDYINVNSSSSITPTNAITVEAWVKPTNFTCAGTDTNCSILSKYGGNYIGYKLETNSSGTPFFNICTPSTCPMASSTIPLIAGQWNYVAATWSPSTIKIYVNGVLSGTGSASTLSQDSTTLSIGKASWYNGDYFNGIIDEVRISNIARTPDEIRQAYEVGRRTHPITIDFKAKLDSGNLISNSSDYSFTVDGTAYGAQTKGSNLYKGDKIVVKENIGGTEYLAQGTVTSVDKDTGAATVASWDSGSTFPSGGFTANATVFKWQREYFDITGSLSTHRDAINRITLRMTDGSQGANIWLDDIRSAGSYLTNPAGSTITSSTGYRYFQYRTIFSTNDMAVSPSLTSVTLSYETNSPPNTPTLDSPNNGATNQLLKPTLKTTATDNDNDTLKYKIQLCTDSGMTQNCQTFDQTVSTTGWSASSYASGAQATYTIQSALNPNQTYYWRSYAIDPTGTNTWSSTQATPYSFTTSAAPTAPANPWCEGQTNPTNISKTNPRFSAVYTDPDANDYANYYEIQVNSQANFNGTMLWDSGKTAMNNLLVNTRSSDVYYAGTALSFNGTTYYWRIKFWDVAGNEGAWSDTQYFTTVNLNPPANCYLSKNSTNSQITVYWTDTNSLEDSYQIDKKTDTVWSTTPYATVPANSTSYLDSSNISNGHTYQYRIRAKLNDAYSDWCYTPIDNLQIGSFKFEGLKMEGVKIY